MRCQKSQLRHNARVCLCGRTVCLLFSGVHEYLSFMFELFCPSVHVDVYLRGAVPFESTKSHGGSYGTVLWEKEGHKAHGWPDTIADRVPERSGREGAPVPVGRWAEYCRDCYRNMSRVTGGPACGGLSKTRGV